MSKLDGRVNKLERIDSSREVQREEMSEQDRAIIQQLSMVEPSVCPDLELVTEADTDPRTFREIQRTLAEARGEFEPEPPEERASQSQRSPRSGKWRSGQGRNEDREGILEALDFIDRAITDSADSASRMDRAVAASRTRLGRPAPDE